MKHSLLLLSFVLLLIGTARAQSANPAVWCPTGSTWTYGYTYFSEQGTLTVRYVRDTVVAGQPAQVLTRLLHNVVNYFGPTPFPVPDSRLLNVVTRVVGSRVEVSANGQFYTLYDFAAPPGTSWLTPAVMPQGNCTQGLARVTVDSVGVQRVGGRSLRWFRAHLSSSSGPMPTVGWLGRIYELIGNTGAYMQPQDVGCNTDPGHMGPLKSFQAVGPPAFAVSHNNGSLVLSAWSRAEAANFSVFPNPAAGIGQIAVGLPAGMASLYQVRLLDAMGRIVRQQAALSDGQFDVHGLPPGTYTLLLSERGRPAMARRVVLQ